jgi:PAS domain S-box-containing protein
MASSNARKNEASPAAAEEPPAATPPVPRRSAATPVQHWGLASYVGQLALLVAVYFGAAKLGLTMAFVAEQVTVVWPPTGISLAALILFGHRLWPGVAIGAFLANLSASTPIGTAAGIAVGNTLEALLGTWLLRRVVGFDNALERTKDVFGLVLLAAGLSTMVSATIGVTSLCLGGVKPWSAYAELWKVWWLGDVIGDLLVAPLLLTWGAGRHIFGKPRRIVEAGILLLGLVCVCLWTFAGQSFQPQAYAIFPFVIWAALRLGQSGATLATFVAAGIAIWGTVNGWGPFAAKTIHESLVLLQMFMVVVSVTTLVLAAITAERKNTETSLQQSYHFLHAVTEGTTDAIYVKDGLGRYLMINTAGAQLMGKAVDEVIGKRDTELVSPETARAIMKGDRNVLVSGAVETYEDVGAANGITRTFLSAKGPYRDPRGKVIGVLGISRDITDRKRSEERFRLVVESAPCGMVMIDHEGKIVLVNAPAVEMFGYDRGVLLGQSIDLLVPDRYRSAHPSHRAGFFSNPTSRAMGAGRELYGRRRDGSEFPVEIGLTPIEMAEGLFVLSAINDITERRRGEESRSRLASIVESSEDAIFSKDLDGVILTWNRAAEKMYGYLASEVVGQPITVLAPPGRAGEVAAILDRLRQGERLENFETVRVKKDGTRMEVSLNISPMPDATGRIIGASTIARDITARKRNERQLATVHAVTTALAHSASLAEAATPILQTVGETMHCDLGVLWEVDASGDLLRCAGMWRAPNLQDTAFERFCEEITFAKGVGLPGQAWDTQAPAWAPDAKFPHSVACRREHRCGAMALPVRGDGIVRGVLEFFGPDLRELNAELLPLLDGVSSQIAQFIKRRRVEMSLYAREKEFSLAREIQQGLFPKASPVLPGFDVAGASNPSQETGGDYFDFIPMASAHWGIALGDASGHGIGPALLIAETRAYLRALAVTHADPSGILEGVNKRLCEDISTGHFVTLFLARLNPSTRDLVYSSAGHLPGYILDGRGEVRLVLPSTDIPLGLYPDRHFPEGPSVQLEPGDLFLLLSDGIIEEASSVGLLFGMERALEVVRAHLNESASDIVAALMHEVRRWSQIPPTDDMTVIILKIAAGESGPLT